MSLTDALTLVIAVQLVAAIVDHLRIREQSKSIVELREQNAALVDSIERIAELTRKPPAAKKPRRDYPEIITEVETL